jgi:glutamate formiminotransferase
VLADLLGSELDLPVYLYGVLGGGRTRSQLRSGGLAKLEELVPDFGPQKLHPTAGATLVAARPPLVAFNLELAPPATIEQARDIASRLREGGPEGLPGVRALGLWLDGRRVAQVSTNIEDHLSVPLARVVHAVAGHAEIGATELVGLAPEAAFEGFPEGVAVRNKRTIEEAL